MMKDTREHGTLDNPISLAELEARRAEDRDRAKESRVQSQLKRKFEGIPDIAPEVLRWHKILIHFNGHSFIIELKTRKKEDSEESGLEFRVSAFTARPKKTGRQSPTNMMRDRYIKGSGKVFSSYRKAADSLVTLTAIGVEGGFVGLETQELQSEKA